MFFTSSSSSCPKTGTAIPEHLLREEYSKHYTKKPERHLQATNGVTFRRSVIPTQTKKTLKSFTLPEGQKLSAKEQHEIQKTGYTILNQSTTVNSFTPSHVPVIVASLSIRYKEDQNTNRIRKH